MAQDWQRGHVARRDKPAAKWDFSAAASGPVLQGRPPTLPVAILLF